MTYYHFLFLSSCLFLTSCTVGPDYEKPETALPSQWQQQPLTAMAENADHQWWHCFKDPTLTELIEKAYQQNHDIKIAVERLTQARAETDQSFADLLPQLGISGQIERERNTVPAFAVMSPFSASQAHFDLSWEIDLFGKRRRQLEASKALAQAELAGLNAVQVSIVAEVAQAYLTYRLQEELLKITDENLATQQKTVQLTQHQFSAGQAARFDFLRADSQLKSTQSQRPKYAAAMASAQYRLEVLLGIQPGTLTSFFHKNPKGVPSTPGTVKIQSPVAVIRQRPDIQIAERHLAAATAIEGATIAQMYPHISLSGFFGNLSAGSLGFGGKTGPHLSSSQNRSWYEAGSISIPLFSFGKLQNACKAAHSETKQALYTYEQSILKALGEIEIALKDLEEERHRHTCLVKAENNTKQAVDIAYKRYQQGATSLLELLDVQRSLFALQEQLAVSKATLAQNLIRLNKAVGGGWQLTQLTGKEAKNESYKKGMARKIG